MARILGIESTCDETAAAIVIDGRKVASSVVATQIALHEKFSGVVPEIASRAHVEHILPVIEQSLEQARTTLEEIDAVAVANRPGLIGSLLIGLTAAKTLAWSLGKPLIAVDHVQAHLYSVVLESEVEAIFPAVGFVCSGGHTALYAMDSFQHVRLIGKTLDDAVGEAYDKVATVLGLGYPGGPAIDKLAATGNPKAVRFPRAMLDRDSLDFSLSGIKTSVLYHVRGANGRERTVASLSTAQIADVAASFQAACIEVIIEKIGRAAVAHGAKTVIVGGGVSANRGLRAALQTLPWPVLMPAPAYCTDNAAMIAGLGDLLLAAGKTSALDLDAVTFSQLT